MKRLNTDNRVVKGIFIICNITVTFGCYKECMIEKKVNSFLGKVYLEGLEY
ncbi:hypothetical protein [uncultured Clostridium sp.]|jgi:NAD(P)H-hydrate repair Nnr-like enzyme with NAD(P)H-hydrate epimerase domain|uniref:hypothetical protein n=1 Tax=uncultured Clostridium sp. TaxID=59620 RepID=UPI00261883BD|nr:hypothetical protein [uncultured Clostridium sp.]